MGDAVSALYGPGIEWHGDKAYARCCDCGKVVQVNKRLGSLHLCLTDCEKYGHTLVTRKRGLFRREVVECERCERRVSTPEGNQKPCH